MTRIAGKKHRTATSPRERREIDRLETILVDDLRTRVPKHEIEDAVDRAHDELRWVARRRYVPALVETAVRRRMYGRRADDHRGPITARDLGPDIRRRIPIAGRRHQRY
jgi:hypothetical protein